MSFNILRFISKDTQGSFLTAISQIPGRKKVIHIKLMTDTLK